MFFGQNKIFTFWTIPSVFFSQNLRLFKKFEAILNCSSCLFLCMFIFLISHTRVFEIIKYFFNFFVFFSPIKFHLNFLPLISRNIMQGFFWIIRKYTAFTSFHATILTFAESWGWNCKKSKRLLFFGDIDNFLLIICYWIDVFVKWINFIVNVFESCWRREIVKSIWSDIFSITLISVIRVTNNIGQNYWNISCWFFPLI